MVMHETIDFGGSLHNVGMLLESGIVPSQLKVESIGILKGKGSRATVRNRGLTESFVVVLGPRVVSPLSVPDPLAPPHPGPEVSGLRRMLEVVDDSRI
jgi:hypothetical protein